MAEAINKKMLIDPHHASHHQQNTQPTFLCCFICQQMDKDSIWFTSQSSVSLGAVWQRCGQVVMVASVLAGVRVAQAA